MTKKEKLIEDYSDKILGLIDERHLQETRQARMGREGQDDPGACWREREQTVSTITYRYRGEVERGTGNTAKNPLPHFKWFAGYSEGRDNDIISFPWMTKKECRRDAESQGKRPVFKEEKT